MTASAPDALDGGFAAALAAISDVDGWLSDDQARRLWERAGAVPAGGTIVEIGSYHGRSTIVLARAAGIETSVVAIDPHAGNDRGPQQITADPSAGDADNEAFRANLERAGVAARVRHVRRPSQEALAEVSAADLVYVDGAHRFGPATADVRGYGALVKPGGTLLVHDAFSSIGVTAALARILVLGRDFAYFGRSRSLAEYRRLTAPLAPAERARNALRQAAELPWFARNLAIKLALVLRARPLAAALGHRPGDAWPY